MRTPDDIPQPGSDDGAPNPPPADASASPEAAGPADDAAASPEAAESPGEATVPGGDGTEPASSPHGGMGAVLQRWEFAQTMLAIHLLNHEGSPEAAEECREGHLHEHLRWQDDFARQVVRGAEKTGLLPRADDRLALTERGRTAAREAVGMGT